MDFFSFFPDAFCFLPIILFNSTILGLFPHLPYDRGMYVFKDFFLFCRWYFLFSLSLSSFVGVCFTLVFLSSLLPPFWRFVGLLYANFFSTFLTLCKFLFYFCQFYRLVLYFFRAVYSRCYFHLFLGIFVSQLLFYESLFHTLLLLLSLVIIQIISFVHNKI